MRSHFTSRLLTFAVLASALWASPAYADPRDEAKRAFGGLVGPGDAIRASQNNAAGTCLTEAIWRRDLVSTDGYQG